MGGLMENRREPTRSRHEIAPEVSCNTGSSKPSSPTKVLRSASLILMPGRPFAVKEMGCDALKSHCLLP